MLDHLVYATPTLDETVAELARRGVATVPGGQHVGVGTRNHLADLGGGAYLEVIGPDPEQPAPGGPRPFGVDTLEGAALVAWAARPSRPLDAVVADLRAAGYDPGAVADMSRRRDDGSLLSWRLTLRDEPTGPFPFLIDWLDSPHPSSSLPSGVVLESFTIAPSDPDLLRRVLAAIDPDDDRPVLRAGGIGTPVLAATLRLADGTPVEL